MENNSNYRKHIGFFADMWIHKDTKPITKEYPLQNFTFPIRLSHKLTVGECSEAEIAEIKSRARAIGNDFKRHIMSLGYHPASGQAKFDSKKERNVCIASYYPSKRAILFKKFQRRHKHAYTARDNGGNATEKETAPENETNQGPTVCEYGETTGQFAG